MNVPRALTAPNVLNRTLMAPFEIGDYVSFAGTLVNCGAPAGFACSSTQPTAGPAPTAANAYISAHTITNNIAIYTQPGSNPVYVAVDVSLMGTGGTTVAGVTEAAARTRFEGFSTDPSRIVHLYGIDFAPVTGATTDRDWGTVAVDPGAALGGAAMGRWRFRPPCSATVAVVGGDCTPPAAGV